MALSGNELTRIRGAAACVGIRLTITAKAAQAGIIATLTQTLADMTCSSTLAFLWNDTTDQSSIWTEQTVDSSVWTEETVASQTWTEQ